MTQPFLNDLGSLYDSFRAEDFQGSFIDDAAASIRLLFQSDSASGDNPGPNGFQEPYSSYAAMMTHSKYKRWRDRINYGMRVRAALSTSCAQTPEEHLKDTGYSNFDPETGFPTRRNGTDLTKAEVLAAKREYSKQRKLHDAAKIFTPRFWDETQPSALRFKDRKRLLRIKRRVSNWDSERRANKSLQSRQEFELPVKYLSSSARAMKYDRDRRKRHDSKITMLKMLAAESKLDQLLDRMGRKKKTEKTNEKAKIDEDEGKVEKKKETSERMMNKTSKIYGRIDSSIPVVPFDPPKWIPPLQSSFYPKLKSRQRKAMKIIKEKNKEETTKMNGKIKARVVTRFGPYAPKRSSSKLSNIERS